MPAAALTNVPSSLDILAPYVGVGVVAFLVTLVATPIMRKLAMANGIVDWPDLKRKNHAVPVAYLGGIAIFLGWLAAVVSAYFLPGLGVRDQWSDLPRIAFPLGIILGATAITLTGFFDDVYGIRARVKIGGQLFAAAALASQDVGPQLTDNALRILNIPYQNLNGVHVLGTPLGDLLVSTVGTALIALFVIGACNSVNLIDGLDGLSSGVVGIAMVGFLAITLIVTSRTFDTDAHMYLFDSDPVRVVMCLAVIGAILGFLPYNFNPASIFMGDAGSLLLGYFAATTILLFSDTTGYALLLVTASLIVFAVPITDTSLAIIRRKIRGYPIFAPDNQHIHHLLRRSGLSVKQSVLVMYGAGVVFGTLGVGMVAMELRWRYILVVFFLLYGTIMAVSFKYGAYQLELERRKQSDADEARRIAPDAPINASMARGNDDSAAGLDAPHPAASAAPDDASPTPARSATGRFGSESPN